MRCRLSPTADVPSHTSGAAMCQLWAEVKKSANLHREKLHCCVSWRVIDCVEYPFHVGAEIESRAYLSSVKIANLSDLRGHLALAGHAGAVHKKGDDAYVVFEGKLNLDPHVVDRASSAPGEPAG